MTVKQLSAYLKGVFDDEELLHDVTLSGEVFEVSYSDKHTYVTLTEGDASIRCVHFASRDNLNKGMRVALRGSVRFYDRRTSISFSYSEYFTCGDGEKNAAFNALKQKLKDLGYFENRPKLPKYILNVAVLTSKDGAAVRDFIRVVRDGCRLVNIGVCPVKVQGDGAAAGIVSELSKLQDGGYDVIVLCRGGGSDEDLDCFNDEALAVAVARSKVPIVSAVGHEVDNTLCDFCAGTRAGTPSIAGQIIAMHGQALENDLKDAVSRAFSAVKAKYYRARASLELLGSRLTKSANAVALSARRTVENRIMSARYAIRKKLDKKAFAVNDNAVRLRTAVNNGFGAKRARFDKLSAVLDALDPQKLRERYAEIYRDGKSIKRVEALRVGDSVEIVFADGRATATVNKIDAVKGERSKGEDHGK